MVSELLSKPSLTLKSIEIVSIIQLVENKIFCGDLMGSFIMEAGKIIRMGKVPNRVKGFKLSQENTVSRDITTKVKRTGMV